jgi:hypothetical protein
MAEFKRPTYRTRKWFRLIFRLALIGLIVGSCTQTITWLGQIGIKTTERPRVRPTYYYDYDDYSNVQRSSTRETPSEDVAEGDDDVAYPEYNRHYINGEYR